MPLEFPWFILLFLAVGAVILVFGYMAEKKRREEMIAWARSTGLRHRLGKDRRFRKRFAVFDCFQRGHSRYAHHVCEGKLNGRFVLAFDYHYATTSRTGKSSSTQHHTFSGVIIQTNLPLKPLTIRGEHAFDRLGAMIGFDDIDFESTAFSDKFHVTSPDRRWAHDVLHQETMEFLLHTEVFTIEMAGPWILARRDRRLRPEQFSSALAVAEGIVERLPRYLLRELKGVDA